LKSHPQHALAQRQFHDYGGLFSFELAGGRRQAGQFFAGLERSKQPIVLADSFGAAISLVSYPKVLSVLLRDMEDEKCQREYGISDRFVRFSAGRGSVEPIIEGLKYSLDSIRKPEAAF